MAYHDDVVSLFSTPQRDFLIRNNGDKVKVESLKGKIVAIYLQSLVVESQFDRGNLSWANRALKEVYDDLSPKNNFEVVFVAQVLGDERKDKELFDISFSRMPWLAIPQDDKESRNKLISKLDFWSTPTCTILDDNGKVLIDNAISDFDTLGAELYPFTDERRIEIWNDDMAARSSMSITRLLTRDFLITNDGKKVPVSDLEGKVVAFHSYTGNVQKLVNELTEIYKELRRRGENFEIVFINSCINYGGEKSFMEAFKSMPWLALPYEDRSYLKLMRIFDCSFSDVVIFRPGEKYPDKYGRDIIIEYGIEAYPFTRERITEIEVARLKSLTLESILFSGDCKYIQANSGHKITAADLVNKTILLLFTGKNIPECHQLIPRLITWYNETKERVKDDLEIIHISRDYDPKENCYYGTMPWLELPYDEKYNKNLYWKTLAIWNGVPAIVGFGADGRIFSRNIYCKYFYTRKKDERKIEFPFTFRDINFHREVKSDINSFKFFPEQDSDESDSDEDEDSDED